MNLRKEIRDPNLVTNDANLPLEIRLVDTRSDIPVGERSQIISRSQALDLVRRTGLNLYLMNPTGSPPVYKLLDYGKFRYAEQKRQREQQKKQREHVRTTKEIFFSPVIGEHDMQTKLRHIRDLLADHDVRIAMKLNRHNRFLLTNRGVKSLGSVVEDTEFILNRVLRELQSEAKLIMTDNMAFTTLKRIELI